MSLKFSIWGVIALIVGIAISIWGIILLLNGSASSSWTAVKGEIIESKVDVNKPINDRPGNKNKTTYEANVQYRYAVDKITYSGNTVSFGEYSSKRPDDAREIVKRYPKGKRVDVFYDPKKHDSSVLEPGVTGSSYLQLGFGILFIIVGMTQFVKKNRT